MSHLQRLIDSLAYPPTHTYRLVDFDKGEICATGVLEQRMTVLRQFETFWSGGSLLLDVGCNKGFFSLYAKKGRAVQVVGIDPESAFVDLCRALLPAGIFKCVGFRDYVPQPEHVFDRVFIGNGHHHLLREAGGWDWVYKLTAITSPGALVLVEGIPDRSSPDGDEFPGLTEEGFLAAMDPFFKLVDVRDSGCAGTSGGVAGYTPGRRVWLFKRYTLYSDLVDKGDPSELLRPAQVSVGLPVSPRWHQCEISADDYCVRKLYRVLPPTPLWPRIMIASLLPQANPITGIVQQNKVAAGWTEKRLKFCSRRERGDLMLLAEYSAQLARIGYSETDFSSLNIMVDGDKRKIVDKNGVYPIAQLKPEHYDYVSGSLAYSLRSNFPSVPEGEIARLCNALASRDSRKVEFAFCTLALDADSRLK